MSNFAILTHDTYFIVRQDRFSLFSLIFPNLVFSIALRGITLFCRHAFQLLNTAVAINIQNSLISIKKLSFSSNNANA
ncbi:hypothetical protein ES708_18157 [subsurface metagenome]